MLQPHDSLPPTPTTLPLLKLESEKQVEMSSPQNTYADSHEIGMSDSSKDESETKGSATPNRKANPAAGGAGSPVGGLVGPLDGGLVGGLVGPLDGGDVGRLDGGLIGE